MQYRFNKVLLKNSITVDNSVGDESPWGSFSEYTKLNPYLRPYGENGEILKRLDNFVKYTMNKLSRGYTPNPDVMCNTIIKFGAFYDKIGYKYDYIATGHYATRVCYDNVHYMDWWIAPAKDPIKDQVDFIANTYTKKVI